MTTNEQIQQKSNPVTLAMAIFSLSIIFGTVAIIVYGYHQNRQAEEKYNPSFERAYATLTVLADKGCQVPFDECLYPGVATMRVLKAMDREKIAFGTNGVSQAKLDELEDRAVALIASQKLAYLKEHGGVKYPSDVALLEDVCMQVYFRKKTLSGGTPTDAELKNLLPPGVTKPVACDWDEERK